MIKITSVFFSFVKKNKLIVFVLGAIFTVFLINSQYVSYPDEFINLLAGKAINAGKIPYKEFFDHHLPMAWYLSSVILRLSGQSFVAFRTLWSIFAFGCLLSVYFYLRKSNERMSAYYLIFFAIYPFVTVYYWLHLYLADSLAFLFFSIIFWLLLAESYSGKRRLKTLFLLSLLNFFFIFSSMTFIYIALVFYLWIFYLFNKDGISIRRNILLIIWSAAPFCIYLLYLLLSNSYKEFYISNIVYNTKLYISIPNYTRGRFFNPIKFGLTLIYNFYQSYLTLLTHLKDFDLFFPVDLTIALGSLLFLFFLFMENKIIFLFSFLIMSFSAPRSNLTKIGESDYQVGIFIAFGLIAAISVFWRQKYLKTTGGLLNKLRDFASGLLIVYFIFMLFFLVKNTYDKFFLRYTQAMPSITNHSADALFIDNILGQGDKYWFGPYEPHGSFFVKKPIIASKYPSLLPQFREDPYFETQFIDEVKKNNPKIIIYKHEASIFMTPSMEFGKFFVDWMKNKYTLIKNIKGLEVINNPTEIDLREDLYLNNQYLGELVNTLKEKGYVRTGEKSTF